jgi:hypothetical protein
MQRDFANSTLDRMTALFLNQLSTQMLCCLFKYLGGMGKANLQNLKRMLAILKLALNGRGALINRADINLNSLWAQIQKAILAQLVPILSNLLSDLNSTLKKDLSANSTIVAGQCASWDLFSGKLLQYIQEIEGRLMELLIEWANDMKKQDDYHSFQTDSCAENQDIRSLLKIVNMVIQGISTGQLCQNSTIPTDEELSLFYNQIKTISPVASAPGSTDTTSITGTNVTPVIQSNNEFKDCLKKVSPEQQAQLAAWIAALKGQ